MAAAARIVLHHRCADQHNDDAGLGVRNVQPGGGIAGQREVQRAELQAGGVGDHLLSEDGGQRDEDHADDHAREGEALQDFQDPVDDGSAARQFRVFHGKQLLVFDN